MGNQPSKKLHAEQQKESQKQRIIQQTLKQSTPQKKWMQSQKTIQDLTSLMRQETQWSQIIRQFLRTIKTKHQYKRYLRAILEQILQISYNIENDNTNNIVSLKNQQPNGNLILEEEKLIKQRHLPSEQIPTNYQEKLTKTNRMNKQQLADLFKFYKTRLQESYFVVSHQKGSVRQNIDEVQFQVSLKQLEINNSSHSQSYNESHFPSAIPSLMASHLYQYPSINQKYMNELFMELNIKAYDGLEEFTHLLVEDFIIVEDEFNLSKFIVEHDVLMKSLIYLETCTKLMEQEQRQQVFQKIRKLKENPSHHYISMSRIFLKYKNVQSAQLIINNMILKGYHLAEHQLKFYLYVELYHIFLYGINYSQKQFQDYMKEKHQQVLKESGSFLSFGEEFETMNIEDVLDMFLTVRSYNEIQQIRKCFETAQSLYEPKRGERLFLKHLKNYALGSNSHFIIAIQALKNHLSLLEQQHKQDIELQFLHKLSLQMNSEIIDYERHVIELMKMYSFSREGYEFIKVIFKVSSILNKFEISLKVSQLCQFLFYNRKLASFLKFKTKILSGLTSHELSSQQLQFQALIIMKKVITRYFTLSQSRQQVVFIIEDKFDDECFEYSTKEIQSLFIMTEYLHTNMLESFIPLQQLHQLLFQHMLHFYKYDQVEEMLREQNLERYFIQKEVVKMLILQNVREMLVKSEKDISVISQDIKKQLKIVQNIILNQHQAPNKNKLLEFDHQQQNTQHQAQQKLTLQQIDASQMQQLQSIRSLFRLMIKLDFYSISLSQEQKENININLLYFLISHYQHQIEVFDYDQLYRLILLVEVKYHDSLHGLQENFDTLNRGNQNVFRGEVPVTNEYLKFKIDLAHLAYEKGKIKFGEQVLKQVLHYEPPWISSQIIKIIQKSPHSAAINHSFLNIAFQYCVKGEDLVFLLQVWKQKMNERQKKTGQKITDLFENTKKYIIVDDSYVKDEKQYRNLVAQMTFNDQTLKSKDYELFFTLLGTEPSRAFYMIYSKGLDVVKIEIILKQGMKQGILNCVNVTKIFFKLLYFMIFNSKAKSQSNKNLHNRISFIKFKSITIEEVVEKLESQKLFQVNDKSKSYQKEIPFIFLKKLYKPVKSLLLLPVQFIQNYLENSSNLTQQNMGQYLQMFLYDENYREKHLIALKDEPMGKNDIKLYRQLCLINGLNILDLILFNLTNQLNTIEVRSSERIFEDESVQNVLQKIVTWTQKDANLLQDILAKLTTQIFSSQMVYNILKYLREKQNPIIREVVTEQHMQILQSLQQIQVNTQFHGLITQQFFQKPISYNPKQKLSEKHTKILKKQLKLRNVFLISKIMYFCYGMSSQVEKQVLKLFIKENQNQHDKKIFEQLKAKLQQSEN